MRDIAIYGAGGFGREIACLIKRINREVEPIWNIIGFFDDGIEVGQRNEYGIVIGNMDKLNKWDRPLAIVFAIGNPRVLEVLYKKIHNPYIKFPNIISPDTIYNDPDNIRMGFGNIICPRSLLSCNVEIGNFNMLNGYVIIGHDCIIGNYNTIMPAVKISGGVKVGNRNFLGVNSSVIQYKTIGDDTIIGASSVVMRNTKNGNTYIGNPAKKIEY